MDQLSTYWIEIIGKQLSGEISDLEQEKLVDWLSESDKNQDSFDEFRKLWGTNVLSFDSSTLNIDADWVKVRSNITVKEDSSQALHLETKPAKVISLGRRIAAVAAIFLLSILSYNLYQNYAVEAQQFVSIEFSNQTQYPISLPDGSLVWLNKGSSIQYDPNFEERHLSLSGEAFFEVTKNPESPFEVSAFGSTTRVLGTRFNLKADTVLQEINLFVEEGKVAFGLNDNLAGTKILTAGEGAVALKKNKVVEKTQNPSTNILSWKTKELNFEHQPISMILEDISSYFGITIIAANEGTLNCQLKTKFVNPSLEEVFETITFSLGGTIQKLNDQYVIQAPPCEKE